MEGHRAKALHMVCKVLWCRMEIICNGGGMKLGSEFFVDEFKHALDVLEVCGTIFKHGLVFLLKFVGDSLLEFEAPPMDVMGVTQVSFS